MRPVSSKIFASVQRRSYGSNAPASLKGWATLNVNEWNGKNVYKQKNFLNGDWVDTAKYETVVDPCNGEKFLEVSATSVDELKPFIEEMVNTPHTGLHNPFKNPERYLMLANVSNKVGQALRDPDVIDYFSKLISRVTGKSYKQSQVEVSVTAAFLENFCGDNVRQLARSFGVPGDHVGQVSRGYRFPFGPVTVIAPFNFPLEIPVLQLMGALYMGNRPLLKADTRVAVVMEQFVRLLIAKGLPPTDVLMLNADGNTTHTFLTTSQPRMTLFTGSSRVAEILARDLHGKIKLEDAGFGWKVLGPDFDKSYLDYTAFVSDQDAYACSGQKCSAQSLLIAHQNWVDNGFFDKIKTLAARRKTSDGTIGPVLTVTTERALEHAKALLAIPGARVLFGAKELPGNHGIPKIYGAIEPTAIYVPLEAFANDNNHKLITTEIFGPFQVVTSFKTGQEHLVKDILRRNERNLTAAIVSNDALFVDDILSNTFTGTTYTGMRARTTGAPQNHWFGPSGDPRGAGIGTKEAIQLVWSSHREIVQDIGPIPKNWTLPDCS